MLLRLTLFSLLFYSQLVLAVTELDCYQYAGCIGGKSSRGQASTNPSFGNQIRINPSAVPTEKGFGLEGILYKNDVDFSIVQGLGRVGAGISPSNSEETFFGPPGIEMADDYYYRKYKSEKFPNQKYTLAVAFNLIKKKNDGLKSYSLQLGVMGRYNTRTKSTSPGTGLNGVLGPFTFGASIYNDETQLEDENYQQEQRPVVKYQVDTWSAGISLGSVLLDYSVLRAVSADTGSTAYVRLYTASLLVKRLIFTYSRRSENSSRSSYNYDTQQLEFKEFKNDIFLGVQANVTKNLMIGMLYNYHLLREYSLTATLFF